MIKSFNISEKISVMDKVLLLTHTDLDGAGCSVVLQTFMSTPPSIVHVSNAEMSDTIKQCVIKNHKEHKFDWILATDISCTVEVAEELTQLYGSSLGLILLDHHPTAIDLNKYPWALVTSEIPKESFRSRLYKENEGHSSGTSLLYDYFDYLGYAVSNRTDPKLRDFVHMVAAYDTWDWHDILDWDEPKCLNDIMWQYGIQRFETVMINKIKNFEPIFGTIEQFILDIAEEKKDAYIKSIISTAKKGRLHHSDNYYTICYLFATDHFPDVFAAMAKEYNCDINIIFSGRKLMFRTSKDYINVGNIAKECGGGGHAKASGIAVDTDGLLAIVKASLPDYMLELEGE